MKFLIARHSSLGIQFWGGRGWVTTRRNAALYFFSQAEEMGRQLGEGVIVADGIELVGEALATPGNME